MAQAAYKTSIDNLVAKNIAVVVASGNNGSATQLQSPACISSAIAVGATNDDDTVPPYNRANVAWFVYAPGTDVTSSVPGSNYQSFSGTSEAAPQIAAAWAIFKQQLGASTSVATILDKIITIGVPITSDGFTRPRLDFSGALNVPPATAEATSVDPTQPPQPPGNATEPSTQPPGNATETNVVPVSAQSTRPPANPQVNVADPVLVKLVDPALALPGETVTFTLTASNRGAEPATNVTVNDQIPNDNFTLLSASSSKGVSTVTGPDVVFNIGTLNPGEVVTMTIRAQIRADIQPSSEVINTGVLRYSEGGTKTVTASATVYIMKGVLPVTGYLSPNPPVISLVLAISMGLFIGAVWVLSKARTTPKEREQNG